jgi:hypothetical protein
VTSACPRACQGCAGAPPAALTCWQQQRSTGGAGRAARAPMCRPLTDTRSCQTAAMMQQQQQLEAASGPATAQQQLLLSREVCTGSSKQAALSQLPSGRVSSSSSSSQCQRGRVGMTRQCRAASWSLLLLLLLKCRDPSAGMCTRIQCTSTVRRVRAEPWTTRRGRQRRRAPGSRNKLPALWHGVVCSVG